MATTEETFKTTVRDGDGNKWTLSECECDNTHEQNQTVCRWCYAQGIRHQEVGLEMEMVR